MKEGYDRASTNKIAAVAGVSIGSLYQYFPSKEALVAAVIDRHMHEMLQLVRDALVATRPIEVAARELVSVMIDAHRVTSDDVGSGSWLCENSKIEFACRNFISISSI
jgi:AcrR family transcriptional regulator